jgi:hypothetical protein
VQNRQKACVAYLCQAVGNLDVLAQNGFGRGALSEAIAVGDADVAQLLLEHPTANEAALMAGKDGQDLGKVVEEDDDEGDGGSGGEGGGARGTEESNDARSVTHRMMLDPANEARVLTVKELVGSCHQVQSLTNRGVPALKWAGDDWLVQEIKGADSPFGSEAVEDTTGLGIWSASLLLARWALDMRDRIAGASVSAPVNVTLHSDRKAAVLAGCSADGRSRRALWPI